MSFSLLRSLLLLIFSSLLMASGCLASSCMESLFFHNFRHAWLWQFENLVGSCSFGLVENENRRGNDTSKELRRSVVLNTCNISSKASCLSAPKFWTFWCKIARAPLMKLNSQSSSVDHKLMHIQGDRFKYGHILSYRACLLHVRTKPSILPKMPPQNGSNGVLHVVRLLVDFNIL